MPRTHTAYWAAKIERNKERDVASLHGLRAVGWDVLVIWECEMKDRRTLGSRIKTFLDG